MFNAGQDGMFKPVMLVVVVAILFDLKVEE
jgi:hypothetical protein